MVKVLVDSFTAIATMVLCGQIIDYMVNLEQSWAWLILLLRIFQDLKL